MTESSPKAEGSVGISVKEMFTKSEYKNLNFPFGYTNNSFTVFDTFGHAHELGRSPDFFALSSKAIETSLSKDMGILGPYTGIVLRFDVIETLHQDSEETEVGRILEGTDTGSAFFVMRVRIPELHAHLPAPKIVVEPDYEKSNFDNLDANAAPCKKRVQIANRKIDMYPQFSGYILGGDLSNAPQVGSFVRVDFTNRAAMVGGFYLGPLTNKGAAYTETLYQQATDAYNKQLKNPKEKNIATQPKGQFDSPNVSEENQVAKPKSEGGGQ